MVKASQSFVGIVAGGDSVKSARSVGEPVCQASRLCPARIKPNGCRSRTVFIQSLLSIMNQELRRRNVEALIAKCRGVMARQDKAWSTEDQYCGYIRQFLWFTFTLPTALPSEKKLEAWLTKMALEKDVAVSTQNTAFHAVRWFYQDVMGVQLKNVDALRATRPAHVRHAPTVDETFRLMQDVRDVGNYPTNLITRILYQRGLRLCEPLDLRIKDVQFETRKLFIMGGKFRKDRVVNLPESLVPEFQRQILVARTVFERDVRNQLPLQIPHQLARKYPEYKFHWQWAWVFPAHRSCRHRRTGELVRFRMHESYVQQAIRESRRRLGILCLPHELRHGHITHLLDRGVNIKALQEEAGHKNIETTARYSHAEACSVPDPVEVIRRHIIGIDRFSPFRIQDAQCIKSPLDA